MIVNETFARRFFPGEDAIGKRIKPGATNGKEGMVLREIVGIVGNASQAPLGTGDDPVYYVAASGFRIAPLRRTSQETNPAVRAGSRNSKSASHYSIRNRSTEPT